MGKLVMGYWDCPYCGAKGIAGNITGCPSCGRARGDVQFYMKNVDEGETREQHETGDIEYLTEEQAQQVSDNPDWYCSFCNSLNSDNAQFCTTCGASRADSESNYFDQLKKKKEKEAAEAAAQAASRPVPKKKSPLAILAVAAAVIIALVLFLNSSKTTGGLTVSSLNWQRIITVEKNRQFSESGWQAPDGAEVTSRKQELHHYDRVLDHYENREVQRSRQVVDHYETYYTYSDRGNGTFEQISHQRPIYTTEYYTETVREPVYRQVPRYATKYYYNIRRWVADHNAEAAGTDQNPYWPELNLASDEREGQRSEEYRFTVEDPKNQSTKTYRIAEADWMKLTVGESLGITSKRTGGSPYISDEKGEKVADIELVE